MKAVIAMIIGAVFSGCMYRVNVTAEEPAMLGKWRIKTDACIIRYDDQPFQRFAYACVPDNAIYFPNRDYTISDAHIGTLGEGTEIIGFIRAGSEIAIERVIKDNHATMGVSYHPYAKVPDHGGIRGEVNFTSYCRDSADLKTMNPLWIERPNEDEP